MQSITLPRSRIRYCIYRCKGGTAEQYHLDVLSSYQSQLDELDLTLEEFTIEWDIDKKDVTQIVTGKIVRKMNRDISLFTGEGKLKE